MGLLNFEDDEGNASQFDGAVGRLTGTKKLKRLRVDLLTSCAKVLRDAGAYLPDFLIGFGQGGVIAALVRWPLVVELTLQARNLQRKEAQVAASAWGKLKAVWSVEPKVWRSQCGADDCGRASSDPTSEFTRKYRRPWGRLSANSAQQTTGLTGFLSRSTSWTTLQGRMGIRPETLSGLGALRFL